MKNENILHKVNDIKEALISVFRKPFYMFLAGWLAFLIFSLFIILPNLPIFLQALSIGGFVLFPKIAFNTINMILEASGKVPLIVMMLVAIIGGINISMIIFKFKTMKQTDGSNVLSLGGLVGSALGAGCPACSTSLLSVLGVAGGLSVLPFKGVEFTLTGLIILLVSLYFISKSISNCEECKIK